MTDTKLDRWVERLNRLAQEMDMWAQTLHPSAWPEQLGPLNERYRGLAAREAGALE